MLANIRISELKRKLSHAESKKVEFSDYMYDLLDKHNRGEIDNYSFLEFFYKKMDGKNINEWIEHLNNYARDCKREINRERIKMVKNYSVPALFLLLAALITILLFRFL